MLKTVKNGSGILVDPPAPLFFFFFKIPTFSRFFGGGDVPNELNGNRWRSRRYLPAHKWSDNTLGIFDIHNQMSDGLFNLHIYLLFVFLENCVLCPLVVIMSLFPVILKNLFVPKYLSPVKLRKWTPGQCRTKYFQWLSR